MKSPRPKPLGLMLLVMMRERCTMAEAEVLVRDAMRREYPCSNCRATGFIHPPEICSICHGTGIDPESAP